MTLKSEVETILRRARRVIRRPWIFTESNAIRTRKNRLCPLQAVTGQLYTYKAAAWGMGYSGRAIREVMNAVDSASAEFYPLAKRILKDRRIGRQAR